MSKKVEKWVEELKTLSSIAKTQPQAAYVAFIVGYRQKFNYIFRTINDISDLLHPIENVIRFSFIPAICDERHCNDNERQLLSLPIKLGGLGIINVIDESKFQYETSKDVTNELTNRIIQQSDEPVDFANSKKRLQAKKVLRRKEQEKSLNDLLKNLQPIERKAVEIAQLEAASSWLTTLPLKEENFVLNKQEFLDAICMRYAWQMKRLPAKCACQVNLTLDHALSCHLGGFTIQRHNNIRDVTANLLREVCHDVSLEPTLLDASSESKDLKQASSFKGCDARADVSANGFWIRYQRAFFDVKVTNLIAPSYREKSICATFSSMEKQKKRAYNQRIQQVDKGTFTPLIFGATGGTGRECSIFLSKLADKLAAKKSCAKSTIIANMRRKLSFILVRRGGSRTF